MYLSLHFRHCLDKWTWISPWFSFTCTACTVRQEYKPAYIGAPRQRLYSAALYAVHSHHSCLAGAGPARRSVHVAKFTTRLMFRFRKYKKEQDTMLQMRSAGWFLVAQQLNMSFLVRSNSIDQSVYFVFSFFVCPQKPQTNSQIKLFKIK